MNSAIYAVTTERHPNSACFPGEPSDIAKALERLERLKPYPAQEELLRLFDYNAGSGELRWKESRGNVCAGSIAGNVNNSNGYRQIKIDGIFYQAHANRSRLDQGGYGTLEEWAMAMIRKHHQGCLYLILGNKGE